MIQNTTFTGAKSQVAQYLEKKAALAAKDLAENTRIVNRSIIKSNQNASKGGQYIPAHAYFGEVPIQPRAIGESRVMDSIAITKTQVPTHNAASKSDAYQNIVPENSINYLA